MKQIIKFFMLAIPAILAVSCQSSNEIEQTGTRECKYNYVFNVAEESTRAGVSGTSVLWLTGDKLGVFAGSTVNTEGVVNAENSPVQFQFGTTEPLEANDVINCYYPYSASNASATTTSVTLTIPTVQPNPNLGMPMVSLPYKVVGNEANVAGNVKFLNLAGYLKFNIACQEGTDYSSETIQSVTFTAAQPLAGSFNFNLAGVSDTDIQTLNISGYDEAAVTALASGNESIGDGKSVYMAVAPGEYSGTITVITDAAKYTFTIPDENKLAVVRAHIKSVKATLKETNRIEGATVALVNNQGYATLADAVTAANNSTKDCKLTLLKDFFLTDFLTFSYSNGRKISFDLNGHAITGAVQGNLNSDTPAMINVSCNFQLLGGENGSITNTNGTPVGVYGKGVNDEIAVIIDGGTYSGTVYGICGGGKTVSATNPANVNITIKDGTNITATTKAAIRTALYNNTDAANIIIEGGEYTSTTSYALQTGAGTTTINGGTFSGSNAIYTSSILGDVVITDGIFNSTLATINRYQLSPLTIEGGYYKSQNGKDNVSKGSSLIIKGGHFTKRSTGTQTIDDAVPNGYTCKDDGETPYIYYVE